MLEDDPASDGAAYLRPAYALAQLRELVPYVRWRGEVRDLGPIDAGAREAFRIFVGLSDDPGCWQPFGDLFAELFCYFDANRSRYIPASGRDYVEPVFAFSTTDENMGDWLGLLGYADHDWAEGAQSFAYMWNYPFARDSGRGFTHIATHEVGHHLGVAHPHDAYDSTTGVDYGPVNEFYYAWVGDATDTLMSYQGLSNEFSVFDKDNLSRIAFAGYVNWANAVLGRLSDVHLSAAETALIRKADSLAGQGVGQFRSWRFVSAAGSARRAWMIVYGIALRQGIRVDAPQQVSAARLRARVGPPPTVDPIRPRPLLR